MTQIISPEELTELKKIAGEARGSSLKPEFEFVISEQGKAGLRRLEETLEQLGCPLKYEEIKTMDFYPLWMDVVNMVTIKRLFNFDDQKIYEMGQREAKFSLIVRIFMRYFFSINKVVSEAPAIWKKFFTVGELEIAEFDKDKKSAIVRIKNFKINPVYCWNLAGYFASVVQMVIGNKVSCKETKCVFRGDAYHEYFLTW